MGLDMYLESRKKIEGYDKEDYVRIYEKFEENYSKFKPGDMIENVEVLKRGSDDFHYSSLTQEEAYWRKFNALHAWFVKNVQNGEDDCGSYPVSRGQLLDLLSLLKRITKNNANKLLPAQSGFFFGSTDYDEWYFQDVAETILKLTHILETFDFDNYELLYTSSW